MTSRLFISLDLPVDEIESIIHLRDEIYGEPNNLKWEKREKLHVTLKFLGDVGENVLDLLLHRLGQIEYEKISARFDKFSFFKKNGKLRILYTSLRGEESIAGLHKLVEDECALIGFERETRKFHPHITLLRFKGGEDLNRLIKFNNQSIGGSEFYIDSFSLVKSELLPTGSEYTILKSFKLH